MTWKVNVLRAFEEQMKLKEVGVDQLRKGQKVIVCVPKKKLFRGIHWHCDEYVFLGVNNTLDAHGKKIIKGEEEGLAPKQAKRYWAAFYEGYLGLKEGAIKKNWRALYDAFVKVSEREIRRGRSPFPVRPCIVFAKPKSSSYLIAYLYGSNKWTTVGAPQGYGIYIYIPKKTRKRIKRKKGSK